MPPQAETRDEWKDLIAIVTVVLALLGHGRRFRRCTCSFVYVASCEPPCRCVFHSVKKLQLASLASLASAEIGHYLPIKGCITSYTWSHRLVIYGVRSSRGATDNTRTLKYFQYYSIREDEIVLDSPRPP